MRHAFIVGLVLLTGTALRADVTARYATNVQFSAALPGMDQAMKSAASAVPSSSVVRMKGTKGYSSYGRMQAVTDLAKQEFILIDPATKTYATGSVDQAMERMTKAIPQVPDDATKALQSMKASFTSKKTGRTATILGIQADETEGVLTVEGPALPGMPQSGPLVTMVLRIWQAQPAEVLRVQPLRELTGYTQFMSTFMNTGEAMRKMMAKLPGFGQGFDSMFQEMKKNKVVPLRTEMEMRMPMMAQLAQQLAKSGQPLPPGFDPNAPFMQMTQEMVE